MATFRKREGVNGVRYQAIVRMGGQPAQSRSFRTKTEAKAWATSVEDAINKDEYIPDSDAKRRTVSEMLVRYLKHEVPKKRDKKNIERYLKFWTERIGTVKLLRVTRPLIVEIRDQMLETKSPATVNRYLATLRHAFRLAATDWGYVTNNPLQRVILTEPRGRLRHLDDGEVKALLAACKESRHPHLLPIVMIALTTGARRGEITGLCWHDVDLTTRRVTLQQTKNNDRRTLTIVPQVVDELRKIQKVRRIDDRIFGELNHGKRTYPGFEAAWRTAMEAAKIEDFRFHDLRHTFASCMAMNGRELPEIAAALGHKTFAMVQRYAHLTNSHVQTAMEETGLKVLGDA